MAGFDDALDFVAQIATLTAKMRENEEKFEGLEAENTTIRAKNVELLVRVETLSVDTTPPAAEVPRARFRVPMNLMQPLEEETTPISSNVHQAQPADPPMTTPGMSGHFAGQQSTTATVSQTQRTDIGGQTQQRTPTNPTNDQQPQPTVADHSPQQTTRTTD